MAQDVAITQWAPDEVVPQFARQTIRIPVTLKASTTYPKGSVLGPVTATVGQYALYASGNSDGSQVAECILSRAYITDASGVVYLGNTVGAEYLVGWYSVTAHFTGNFNVSDLSYADASYLTGLKGKLIRNSTILVF